MKEEVRQKALKTSIKEGSCWGVSNGLTASYITPFALKLSSNEFHIGLLSALTSLASPLSQLFGSKLMESYSRKKIVLKSFIWQSILWLPLAIIALLKIYGIAQSALIYLFIVGYALMVSMTGIAHPSWFSWMGDLVSDKERGKYFSRRNTIIGLIELIALGIATLIIKITDNNGVVLWGFASLFVLASLFRYFSWTLTKTQYTTHTKSRKVYNVKVIDLLKQNKNFKRFAVYQLFFHISLMIASPFFAVYMLKELNFGYLGYIGVTISSTIFYLIFSPLAGKFSDKYGNVKLLLVANICFALNPFLWTFIKSPVLLALIPQLLTGAANAALVLAFNNFSYDYLSKEQRGTGIACVSLLAGIGAFIGGILGGLLLKYLVIENINKYLIVFSLAFVLRSLIAIIFLPKIKEHKKVKRIPAMHINITHPFKTITAEIDWVKNILK